MKTLQAIIILLTFVLYGCSNDDNPVSGNAGTVVLMEKAFVDSTSVTRFLNLGNITIPNISTLTVNFKVESNYISGFQPIVTFYFNDTTQFTLFSAYVEYADSLKNKELTYNINVSNYKGLKLSVRYGGGNLQPGIWVKTYALKIY